jgi:hypothetical protein
MSIVNVVVVVDVDLSVDGDVDVGVLRVDKATSIPDATPHSGDRPSAMVAEDANESELTPHTALDVTSARPLATKPIGVHEISTRSRLTSIRHNGASSSGPP